MVILTSDPGPTPSFYMPEATLLAQTDVVVYQYDATKKTVAAVTGYTASNGAFQWYQASEVAGEGSWWFPVAAVNLIPLQWNNISQGGITDLKSSGNGIWTSEGANRMVRPASLFWWIPADTLNQGFPVTPGSNNSVPLGTFPSSSPYPQPTQPDVVQVGDNIIVTIPPESTTTTINIAASES